MDKSADDEHDISGKEIDESEHCEYIQSSSAGASLLGINVSVIVEQAKDHSEHTENVHIVRQEKYLNDTQRHDDIHKGKQSVSVSPANEAAKSKGSSNAHSQQQQIAEENGSASQLTGRVFN